MLRSAPLQLAQENDRFIHLLDAHVVVLHTRAHLLHLVEFVVVGRKKRLGTGRRMVVQVFDHRPGDRNTVVGTRTASDFVQQDDAAVGNIVQDAGRLEHLDHEGRFALRNIVGSPDSGENLVHHADMSRFRRDERPHLGHQDNEGRLPQQSRLTRHVGTRNHHDLLLLIVQQQVVGDILLPHRHQGFDHRMPSLADFDTRTVVERRTDVVALPSDTGERLQAVDTRHDSGIPLQSSQGMRNEPDQFGVNPLLDQQHLLLGTENFFFVLFQLFGDISLGIGQRLLADPRLGNLVLVRVADFDIITEDIVVAYFQRNSRRLALPLLNTVQKILAMQSDAAQIVQFGVHAVGDNAAPLNLIVLRVGVNLAGDTLPNLRQQIDLSGQRVKTLVVGRFQQGFEEFDRRKRIFKLYDFAGGYPSRRYARSDALQVADLRNLLGDAFGQIGLVVKPLHDIQTFVDAINLLDRQGDPPLEQTPAHRREGAIDHVCERALLARTVRREELQVADREFIDPNVILLVDTRNGRNMGRILMFGKFEVVENGPCRRNAAAELFDTEALERLSAELLAELVPVDRLRKDPLIEPIGIVPTAERIGEAVFVSALVDDFLRRQVGNEFVDVSIAALGGIKFAG